MALSDYFKVNKHALFEENLKINSVLISLKELKIDRSHNYTLDLLMFSGGLGLISWLLLVILVLKCLIKNNQQVLLVGLIIYLGWIQLQIQSIVHLMYFWLLLGLADQTDS